MMFQLTWECDGVVLEVHTDLLKGRFEWVRLRKFRTEGDARLFQMSHCPKMTENEVKRMAMQYVDSDHYAFYGRWIKQ